MFRKLLVLSLLPLTACINTQTYYQAGLPFGQVSVAEDQCELAAQRIVPQKLKTEYRKIYGEPHPETGERPLIDIETYTTDLNDGLRYKAFGQCMRKKGYEWVTIQACKKEQLAGKQFALLKTMPPLSPSLCQKRLKGGRIGLIDLSKPLAQSTGG